MVRDFACSLLPSLGSALLHKRASYLLSSMNFIGPNCMMETTIYYVALGKDVFLTCGFFIDMINHVTRGNFPYTLLKQHLRILRCEDLGDFW